MKQNKWSRRKRLIVGLSVVLVLMASAWIYIEHHVLPYMAIRPHRVDIHSGPWLHGKVLPADYGLDAESFVVKGVDNVDLHGYFIASKAPKGTILLIHGIGACKEFFFDFAKRLHDQHLHVVVMDLRAHGASGGDYCTYGAKEVPDIVRVMDHVQIRTGHLPFAIYGSSLGGAIALQTMAADARIRCGIIESTYHNLEAVMNQYWTNWTALQSPDLVRRTMLRSAAIAGFDPSQLNPSAHCATIDRPVFFAHGTADEKIPMAFNRLNYEAVPAATKAFVVVEGGHHTDLHARGGAAYEQQLMQFLHQALPSDSTTTMD